MKKLATEWGNVNDPDIDILRATDDEAYLLFDDGDDEEIYMLT